MIGEPRGRYLVLLSGFEGDQGVKIIAEQLVAMSCMTAAWETPDVFKVEAIFRRAKTCAGVQRTITVSFEEPVWLSWIATDGFCKAGSWHQTPR